MDAEITIKENSPAVVTTIKETAAGDTIVSGNARQSNQSRRRTSQGC